MSTVTYSGYADKESVEHMTVYECMAITNVLEIVYP